MSGVEILGAISAVIAILEAGWKIWKEVRDLDDLPKTFNLVAAKLPLVMDTLQKCYEQLEEIKDRLSDRVVTSILEIFIDVKARAYQIRNIFEETISGKESKLMQRYIAAVKSIGKDEMVEDLLRTIIDDVRILTDYKQIKCTDSGPSATLAKLQDELQEAPPSIIAECPPPYTPRDLYLERPQGTNNVQDIHGHSNITAVRPAESVRLTRQVQILPYRVEQEVGSEKEDFYRWISMSLGATRSCYVGLKDPRGISKTKIVPAFTTGEEQKSCEAAILLNATSKATLRVSLRRILISISELDDVAELQDGDILDYIRQWLEHRRYRSWIIIFNNHKIRATQMSISREIQDRLSILQSYSRRPNMFSDLSAISLAEKLGDNPAALVAAGAFLYQSKMSIAEYCVRFQEEQDLFSCAKLELDHSERTSHIVSTVTLRHLEQILPQAAQFLQLLIYFDHKDIRYDLLSAGLGKESPAWLQEVLFSITAFRNMIDVLIDYRLIMKHDAVGSYSIPSGVYSWVTSTMSRSDDSRMYWHAFDCVANTIAIRMLPNRTHTGSSAHLVLHAKRLSDDFLIDTCDLSLSDLSRRSQGAHLIAEYLRTYSEFHASERMYARLVAANEGTFGLSDRTTRNSMFYLGKLYFEQGKAQEAERVFATLRSPRQDRRVDGLTNRALWHMAEIHMLKGEFSRAERLYLQALAGFEETQDLRRILARNSLAVLYSQQGRLKDAYRSDLKTYVLYQQNTHLIGRSPQLAYGCSQMLYRRVKAAGVDMPVVRMKLGDLIQLSLRHHRKQPAVLYGLGRALLVLKDEPNARSAFRCSIEYIGAHAKFACLTCKGCLGKVSSQTNLHICRRCMHTELCGRCIIKYLDDKIKIPRCVNHDFFTVDVQDLTREKTMQPDRHENICQWLNSLYDKYCLDQWFETTGVEQRSPTLCGPLR